MSLNKQITTIFKNSVFANLLMVVLLVSGVMAAKEMNREFFPEFKLDLITVTVPYPGASQEEVEEGICTKLENALEGVDGIFKITSTAAEGMGSMLIEVDPDFDSMRVKDEIQNEIDRIDTFPEDAEEPQIQEIVNKDVVITLALYGDAPERTLKEVAKEIKDELLAYSDISHITISGVRDYEISIEVSETTLRKYNITMQYVADAVRRGSLDLPAGQIKTAAEEITIRTKGQKYTGEEFRNIVVLAQPNGSMVYLHEIATITDGFVLLGVPSFALITLIALGTGTADLWMPLLGAKSIGASRRALFLGVVGSIIGTFFAPLLGTILGYAVGILIGEYQVRGDWNEAFKVSLGGVAGWGIATAVQLGGGILMLLIFVWQVLSA